jgi:DNA (cytosine-5)-methyltransferase 1
LNGSERMELIPQVAETLLRTDYKGPGHNRDHNFIAHSLRASGFDASEDGTGRGTPIVPVTMPTLRCGGNDHADHHNIVPVSFKENMSVPSWNVDCSETLQAENFGAVAFAKNQRDEVRMMSVAGALAGEPGMKQQTYVFQDSEFGVKAYDSAGSLRAGRIPDHQMVMPTAMQVRRLTPRECERLQGFPDDYTLIPYRNKPAADGPRYKALGNSMAVPVMRWIGERIQMVSEIP